MMGHVHARGVIEDRHGIQVNVTGRRDRLFGFLNTVVLSFNRLFFLECAAWTCSGCWRYQDSGET